MLLDWLDSLIGPWKWVAISLVSDLFAVPVLVLRAGLEKSKQLKLGCEKNIFAGSHT